MSPNTAKAIQDGFQDLVIDQQPYLQGYLPILNICLTKKYGFSGLDINTAGAFVDAKNVGVVAPLAAKEIR
jgi:simple sugar transport system substrate-binding protein